MTSYKMYKMNGLRRSVDVDYRGREVTMRAVCRRCGAVLMNIEPDMPFGEFWHGPRVRGGKIERCVNDLTTFSLESREVEPFERKSVRRAAKRAEKFR
jgi:hypothetical protein